MVDGSARGAGERNGHQLDVNYESTIDFGFNFALFPERAQRISHRSTQSALISFGNLHKNIATAPTPQHVPKSYEI